MASRTAGTSREVAPRRPDGTSPGSSERGAAVEAQPAEASPVLVPALDEDAHVRASPRMSRTRARARLSSTDLRLVVERREQADSRPRSAASTMKQIGTGLGRPSAPAVGQDRRAGRRRGRRARRASIEGARHRRSMMRPCGEPGPTLRACTTRASRRPATSRPARSWPCAARRSRSGPTGSSARRRSRSAQPAPTRNRSRSRSRCARRATRTSSRSASCGRRA